MNNLETDHIFPVFVAWTINQLLIEIQHIHWISILKFNTVTFQILIIIFAFDYIFFITFYIKLNLVYSLNSILTISNNLRGKFNCYLTISNNF